MGTMFLFTTTALRSIFDSKLNKAGMVGAVYVKTDNGVLFEIKPHVRIPRTCRRFCGVMLELLDKKCIRTKDTNEILMRVIAEPVTRHLPVNSRVVGEHCLPLFSILSLLTRTKAGCTGFAGLSYSS
ncbi:hypothetical protein C1H46_001436 [Malus baccata]|uniref:Uncharacterized protein n=1 Tax=Malus baccata TaxID=106549 RepID=A0A540NPV7_MALBA|nr:hypothetical protein C1H46_001436 [Malus baccata]